MSDIVLGVDPGYLTGVAVVQGDSVTWAGTYRADDDALWARLHEFAAHVRRAVVQTPIFDGGRKTPRWHKSPISLAKNAALSGEIIGFLRGLGLRVEACPPKHGTGMKMSAKTFEAAYGVKCSEHARDAAMLAFSATPERVEIARRAK